MKPKLLISACFCGKNTKYNGGNNRLEILKTLEEKFELFIICPEVMGGLPIPRDPSEIIEDKVFSNQGKDVTKEYNLGAKKALEIALDNNITLALLKEASPACGSHTIYDGTFTGTKIKGAGITTGLLQKYKIKVFSENQLDELFKEIA